MCGSTAEHSSYRGSIVGVGWCSVVVLCWVVQWVDQRKGWCTRREITKAGPLRGQHLHVEREMLPKPVEALRGVRVGSVAMANARS
jgi:hypothetical protein